MKNLNIMSFLFKFGNEVGENETNSFIMSKLENNICVTYLGVLYYIPKDYQKESDVAIFEYLVESCSIAV